MDRPNRCRAVHNCFARPSQCLRLEPLQIIEGFGINAFQQLNSNALEFERSVSIS